MSCISGKDISKHIAEHAVLGVGAAGGGSGDITILNGYATYLDPTRGKTLSSARHTLISNKKGRTSALIGSSGNYLFVGDVALSKTGWRVPRNSTITMISCENSQPGTFDVHLRKNGSSTNLTTLSVSSSTGNQTTTANLDLTTGDKLQVYIEGLARDPIVWIELAWRF